MIKTCFKRPIYLDKIRPFIGKDIIKVIIGQRRVGKSFLLYQIMDEVKTNDPKVNIIYINKELNEFEGIVDHRDLLKYLKNQTRVGKNAIFIDEVQEIIGFEKALRSLAVERQYDIYCTGSNAKLLSSELATGLSARYIEIPVHSLTFSEFIIFHKLPASDESFLNYVRYGGLPYLINLDLKDEIVYDYLRSVYNTILLKDVVARYNIRNVNLLERLVEYVADNVGNLFSAKKISDFLKSQKIRMSPNVVLNYLSYLSSAFFIYPVKRSDIGGKKIFEINEKYYLEDLGLRHAVLGYKALDIGKNLENVVFHHLRVAGYKITVGKMLDKEVDFVCEKDGDKLYVQVTYLLATEAVKEREFGNLLRIEDNYPKVVVSMDKITNGEFKGIKHYNVLDFLQLISGGHSF